MAVRNTLLLSLLGLFLVACQPGQAQTDCMAHRSDGTMADLSPLKNLPDQIVQDMLHPDIIYFVSVCREVNQGGCDGAGVCAFNQATETYTTHGAFNDGPTFDRNKVVLEYQGINGACSAADVIFYCDPHAGDGVPLHFATFEDCVTAIVWRTAHACTASSPTPTGIGKECDGIRVFNETDAETLKDCETIRGDIRVEFTELTNLDFLANVRVIYGSLLITNNAQLTSWGGLQTLTGVEGFIALVNNPVLPECHDCIERIWTAGGVTFSNNPLMKTLRFPFLEYTLFIQIVNMPLVESVLLPTLSTAERIGIISVPMLREVDIHRLVSVGHFEVSQAGLEQSRTLELIFTNLNHTFTLGTASTSEAGIFVNYANVGVISLPQASIIDGSFIVQHVDNIQTISALQLTKVMRAFSISSNSIQGGDDLSVLFPRLIQVPSGYMVLSDNPTLHDVDFGLLLELDQLLLVNNSRLATTDGFCSLTSVDSLLIQCTTSNIPDSLRSLDGFSNLAVVSSMLSIRDCEQITDVLPAFSKLAVAGSLVLESNENLCDLPATSYWNDIVSDPDKISISDNCLSGKPRVGGPFRDLDTICVPRSGLKGWAIFLIVLLVLVVVAAGGYFGYVYYKRRRGMPSSSTDKIGLNTPGRSYENLE